MPVERIKKLAAGVVIIPQTGIRRNQLTELHRLPHAAGKIRVQPRANPGDNTASGDAILLVARR